MDVSGRVPEWREESAELIEIVLPPGGSFARCQCAAFRARADFQALALVLRMDRDW